jgi:hypothetical protein
MRHTTQTRSMIVLAMALCGGAGTAWAAGKAHEHGALKLDVAIEGNKLTIAMEAPLDNLLGFERAPRTDAERKAATDVLTRLRSPDKGTPLFVLDAAAQCTLGKADVQAPVLEPGAKPAAKDEHADLVASYEFTCAKPDELRMLEVGLFDVYKRTQRIDVQVAGPKGQAKVTLKRPVRKVQLVR